MKLYFSESQRESTLFESFAASIKLNPVSLVLWTSKCTYPIVQEQMISYYNDIDLYMLNMVNTEWTNIKETTAATLKHWPWTFPS